MQINLFEKFTFLVSFYIKLELCTDVASNLLVILGYFNQTFPMIKSSYIIAIVSN